MSSIVPASEGSEPDIVAELRLVEQAGIYAVKGYRNSEIARLLNVTNVRAKKLVTEYYKFIEYRANEDPLFLERIQFNTIKTLDEFDEILKETWETIQMADDNEMVTARLQGLKLASDLITKKAQLHNLLSGGMKGSDNDAIQRMTKIENANQILSDVLRDVISDCPRCKELARVKLAEAFSLMNDDAEVENE